MKNKHKLVNWTRSAWKVQVNYFIIIFLKSISLKPHLFNLQNKSTDFRECIHLYYLILTKGGLMGHTQLIVRLHEIQPEL